MFKKWIICVSVFAASNTVVAVDNDGLFAIKGAGFATCAAYLEEQKKTSPRYYQFGGWLSGYLTSINETSADTFDLAPWQSPDVLAAFVTNYCERYRKRRFYEAVRDLATALMKDRLQSGSPSVQAQVGDKVIVLYRAVVERIQRILISQQYYKSTVDGQFGPETRRAIEQFQKDNKLPVSGLPDQVTLHKLFRASGAAPPE